MRKMLASMLEKTSSRNRPWQIAFGVTLGVLCGCAVNSPVVAVCCAAAAFWMPLHMIAFAVTTTATALAVVLLAPSIGQVGQWSLQHPAMIGTWTQLESLPLFPWLGLHNTLVNGGLIIAALGCLPIGIASYILATWVLKSHKSIVTAEENEFAAHEAAIVINTPEEDSFVELTSADLKMIESLEKETGGAAISEQQRRIDIAAMGIPTPNFPVHNFEIDDAPPTSQTESEPDSKPAREAKVPNPYAFDAVERLEELLSGCRVQPHWAGANREAEAADHIQANLEDAEDHRSQDELGRVDEDVDVVPTSNEVLHRSHEIAGLVDQLIASLDDIEGVDQQTSANQQAETEVAADSISAASATSLPDSAEMRFDTPHTITNIHGSGQADSDTPVVLQPDGDIESNLRSVHDEMQLRFDQIDMSEQFSKPLYQPHTPNKPDDMQVAKRGSAGEHSKSLSASPVSDEHGQAALDARIERLRTPSIKTTEQETGTKENAQSDASTESIVHVVQRGHDEALRHLLHHLREIEERVRK